MKSCGKVAFLCKFCWENLSTTYHQSGLLLRRVYSAALIIPLFGVMDQLSCSQIPVIREMSQCWAGTGSSGFPQAVWRAFPVAWEPSVSRCFFVPLKLWEPLQRNITEVFLSWQKKKFGPGSAVWRVLPLCQIYVWCLSKGCLSPVLLEIKSSTSRLLSFTHSSHPALIEMLNLPLQVINYQLKSSCPIKGDVKTPDTLIRYDLHQNLTKLFPSPPKAIYFYNYLPIYL